MTRHASGLDGFSRGVALIVDEAIEVTKRLVAMDQDGRAVAIRGDGGCETPATAAASKRSGQEIAVIDSRHLLYDDGPSSTDEEYWPKYGFGAAVETCHYVSFNAALVPTGLSQGALSSALERSASSQAIATVEIVAQATAGRHAGRQEAAAGAVFVGLGLSLSVRTRIVGPTEMGHENGVAEAERRERVIAVIGVASDRDEGTRTSSTACRPVFAGGGIFDSSMAERNRPAAAVALTTLGRRGGASTALGITAVLAAGATQPVPVNPSAAKADN